MDEPLLAYMDRLELMVFFVGYPLIYAAVHVIAGLQHKKRLNSFFYRITKLLPIAYALSGTLFIGLILKYLYPDYSVRNIAEQFQYTYLKIWGLFALLFWIPFFVQKPFLSLLHSLVFFFFLLKDLFIWFNSDAGTELIKNDMKIYTDSVLLNIGTLVVTVIFSFLFGKFRKYRNNRLTD